MDSIKAAQDHARALAKLVARVEAIASACLGIADGEVTTLERYTRRELVDQIGLSLRETLRGREFVTMLSGNFWAPLAARKCSDHCDLDKGHNRECWPKA